MRITRNNISQTVYIPLLQIPFVTSDNVHTSWILYDALFLRTTHTWLLLHHYYYYFYYYNFLFFFFIKTFGSDYVCVAWHPEQYDGSRFLISLRASYYTLVSFRTDNFDLSYKYFQTSRVYREYSINVS